MRIRVIFAVLLAVALAGCVGGIAPGPNQPPLGPGTPVGPAEVVITGYEVSLNAPMYYERITLDLKNNGGPGVFKLVFTGAATVPNGPPEYFGETEAFAVSAGWSDTVTFEIETGATGHSRLRRVRVLTRDADSLEYRETDNIVVERVSL